MNGDVNMEGTMKPSRMAEGGNLKQLRQGQEKARLGLD